MVDMFFLLNTIRVGMGIGTSCGFEDDVLFKVVIFRFQIHKSTRPTPFYVFVVKYEGSIRAYYPPLFHLCNLILDFFLRGERGNAEWNGVERQGDNC